uniref:HAUS augmin-like complex subunit 3 N-terminal domain-containing protein n=1 Tax=Cairina moschata TaxID=8855 RepID=A0A8C3GR06_CAIMO
MSFNRGAEFVKTLQLVYPQAETLCESDFDWLFDCPETEQFLEWFCKTVGEENVLSPAEVQAYDALVAAGKPILEGDELEQALQKCQCVPQLPRMIPEAEGPSLEDLEQEIQELKDYRARQLWRHNKLQVWAACLQQELSYLQEEEKVMKRTLSKAQVDLEREVFQATAVLNQINKVAKQLVNWHGEVGKDRSPVMLYEMDLSHYIKLEQHSADMFEQFFQQVLTGTAQAPDAQGADVRRESSLQERLEAWREMDLACEIQERRQVALSACPDTAPSSSLTQRAVEAQLRSKATMFQEQLHALRSDIAHIHTQQLLPLLKAGACLFLLPILQAQLNLETARLQDISQRQEEAVAWLASQHSRLDLLGLQLKRERKELDQKAAWLREMETRLKDAQTRLQEYHDYFKEADSSMKGCLVSGGMRCSKGGKKSLLCIYMHLGSAPQETTELMHQLTAMQDTLYQKLADLLSDLKVKRSSLQNPILQAERNLYIYFFCNEDQLREVVEKLEKEALDSSKRLLMEPPNTKE